jgi:hypothetical protein
MFNYTDLVWLILGYVYDVRVWMLNVLIYLFVRIASTPSFTFAIAIKMKF